MRIRISCVEWEFFIIAGDKELDCSKAAVKLKELFGIEMLMLGGGGVLNWSLIQAGICDEISIVVAPVADGSPETPALFAAKAGLSDVKSIGFQLQNVEEMNGGSVWLRHLVKK